MNRWPSWKFERALDEAEQQHTHERIAEKKAEAEQALQVSREQLAEVRRITKVHKPIRQRLRRVREENHFTEGLLRIIEEGR